MKQKMVLLFFIFLSLPALYSVSAADECKLYFDLYYESNWFTNLYDVDVYLDDVYIGKVVQGKSFTALIDTQTGSHTVYVYKTNDKSVSGQRNIELSGNSTFACTLHANSNNVELKSASVTSNIEGASLLMPNVYLKNLRSAMNDLKKIGFINISSSAYDGTSIWNEETWTVIGQNIDAGSIIDKNEKIVLTCQPTDSFLNQTFLKKTVPEAILENSSVGYNLHFTSNITKTDMTDDVLSMNSQNQSLWVVNSTKMENAGTYTVNLGLYFTGDVIMPDVTGISLEQAYTVLKENNFLNIDHAAQDGSIIWNYGNWKVVQQNIPAGSVVSALSDIRLTAVSYSSEQTAIAEGRAVSVPTSTPMSPTPTASSAAAGTEPEPVSPSADETEAVPVGPDAADRTSVISVPQTESYARRAAVTALTNYYALDVYAADGVTVDTAKFHSYSDAGGNLNDYYIEVEDWGIWTETSSGVWKASGLVLNRVGYNFLPELTLGVGCSADLCTVYNLRDGSGNPLTAALLLSESADAFKVPFELLEEDRE